MTLIDENMAEPTALDCFEGLGHVRDWSAFTRCVDGCCF